MGYWHERSCHRYPYGHCGNRPTHVRRVSWKERLFFTDDFKCEACLEEMAAYCDENAQIAADYERMSEEEASRMVFDWSHLEIPIWMAIAFLAAWIFGAL